MEDHNLNSRFYFYCFFFCSIFFSICNDQAGATKEKWQKIDTQLSNNIFRLNVGIDVRFKNGPWIQLSGLSPQNHYYVFTTKSIDQGYQIVGHGTCFPIAKTSQHKMLFATCQHIIADATETAEECQMFYAAMQFYAIKTAKNGDYNRRVEELLKIINLALQHDLTASEKNTYSKTVDAIWELYDASLSPKADPKRILFNKYKNLASLIVKTAFIIHAPDTMAQSVLEAKIYKPFCNHNLDLAILESKPIDEKTVSIIAIDSTNIHPTQSIQVIGYPIEKQSIKNDVQKNNFPTFSSGKIIKVMPNLFEFEALVSKGNSGGPVINEKGKVIGMVVSKASDADKLHNYGIAISAQAIKNLAPELFKNVN